MNKRTPPPGPTPTDWHPADIQADLKKRGWTLRKLSIAAGYSPNACNQCLRRSWPSVERVIARALGLEPWQIWPSRYDERHQPRYRRPTPPRKPFKGKRNPSRSAHEHNVNPVDRGGRHAPAKRKAA